MITKKQMTGQLTDLIVSNPTAYRTAVMRAISFIATQDLSESNLSMEDIKRLDDLLELTIALTPDS